LLRDPAKVLTCIHAKAFDSGWMRHSASSRERAVSVRFTEFKQIEFSCATPVIPEPSDLGYDAARLRRPWLWFSHRRMIRSSTASRSAVSLHNARGLAEVFGADCVILRRDSRPLARSAIADESKSESGLLTPVNVIDPVVPLLSVQERSTVLSEAGDA
jgi:hypothetical protein